METPMTAGELITTLQRYDPNRELCTTNSYASGAKPITTVRSIEPDGPIVLVHDATTTANLYGDTTLSPTES